MPQAMVWGAAGGIGRALVEALLAEGWQIATVTRSSYGLADLDVQCYEADFADDFAVRQAVMAAAQEIDPVELWIYAAGDIASARVDEMQADDWHRLMTANVTGAFLATHHSLPLLTENATLVYLGAVSERLQLPGLSGYAAAKSALDAFTTALAKEERRRKVILVRPGAVDTPLWSKANMRLPKNALSASECAQQILAAVAAGKTGRLDLA